MGAVIRLQNLPSSANALDIRQYFQGLHIREGGIWILGGELGDAFILFSNEEDAHQAMLIDNGKIKEKKIKLFISSREEMKKVTDTFHAHIKSVQSSKMLPTKKVTSTQVVTNQKKEINSETCELNQQETIEKHHDSFDTKCIVLAGLPLTVTSDDVKDFFFDEGISPTEIIFNYSKGNQDKPKVNAFCLFNSFSEVIRALKKNKQLIGSSVVYVKLVSKENSPYLPTRGSTPAIHNYKNRPSPKVSEKTHPPIDCQPLNHGFPFIPSQKVSSASSHKINYNSDLPRGYPKPDYCRPDRHYKSFHQSRGNPPYLLTRASTPAATHHTVPSRGSARPKVSEETHPPVDCQSLNHGFPFIPSQKVLSASTHKINYNSDLPRGYPKPDYCRPDRHYKSFHQSRGNPPYLLTRASTPAATHHTVPSPAITPPTVSGEITVVKRVKQYQIRYYRESSIDGKTDSPVATIINASSLKKFPTNPGFGHNKHNLTQHEPNNVMPKSENEKKKPVDCQPLNHGFPFIPSQKVSSASGHNKDYNSDLLRGYPKPDLRRPPRPASY